MPAENGQRFAQKPETEPWPRSARIAVEALIFLGLVAGFALVQHNAPDSLGKMAERLARSPFQRELEIGGALALTVLAVALAVLKQRKLGLFGRLEILLGFGSACLAVGKFIRLDDDGDLIWDQTQALVLVSSLYFITRGVDHVLKEPRSTALSRFMEEAPEQIVFLEQRIADLERERADLLRENERLVAHEAELTAEHPELLSPDFSPTHAVVHSAATSLEVR